MSTDNLPLTAKRRDGLIQQVCSLVAAALDSGNQSSENKPYAEKMCEVMVSYPDRTVALLADYCTSKLDSWEEDIARERLLRGIASEGHKVSHQTLHEYLAFLPALDTTMLGPLEYLRMFPALHTYPQLPDTDEYTEVDAATRQQIIALLDITTKLCLFHEEMSADMIFSLSPEERGKVRITPETFQIPLETGKCIRITSPELVNLIVEYPEQTESIIDLFRKRDLYTDISLLCEIITSETQSLREGML